MAKGKLVVKKLPDGRGLLVSAPEGVSCKSILAGQEESTMQNIERLVVMAEENSELELISLTDCRHNIGTVEVFAKAGSKVRLSAMHTGAVSGTAVVEKGASVNWTGMVVGEGKAKVDVTCSLNGERAESRFVWAFIGKQAQKIELTAKVIHNAPNTTSSMKVKGALRGSSSAVVHAFTKITEKAANSEGSQDVKLLLLGRNSSAMPIPKLEIDNCNTRASHSASVGRLDSGRLFYMKSRGLSEKDAVRLAVEGFFEPMLREMPNNSLADYVRKAIC